MSLSPFFRKLSSHAPTRLIGARKSALDVARGRLVFIGFVIALAYILLAARMTDLTLIQGELPRLTRATAQEQTTPQTPAVLESLRGDIIDRNGVLLARSLKTPSLYADPALIADPETVARDLVQVLPDLNYGDVLQRLQRKNRFVWIKRNISPNEQHAILMLGHPGLNFQDESHRIYPQGPLTAHMVGYTNVDGDGLAGIERSFNDLLKSGQSPVQLSLDIRLQHIVRRELARTIREFDAIGGIGAIMDVRTGELLAAVSAPDFNPHELPPGNDPAMFNRLTLGVYEMGSTFKIFSTAALLELRNPGMGQQFDAREPIRLGRFQIRDFHGQNRYLTIPEVFMHSSNIGSAKMAEMIGTVALRDFYRDLGLMDRTPIELGEVGRPLVPAPWRDINTMTAAYGHGIAVTPVQTLSAVASIANGGVLVHPNLVVDLSDKKARRTKDIRIVSERTAHRMRQLMRLVVSDGTARGADIPGLKVGGKTGTAEKAGGGGYQRKQILSSFIGIFPSDAPRYALLVMIDEPKGTAATHGYATGGWVAAPAAGRIVSAMAPVLGIVPEDPDPKNDIATPLKQFVKGRDGAPRHLVTMEQQ